MNLQGNWWNPIGLNNAIKSAFRPSVYTAIADAKAHSPSHVAGATGKVRTDTTAYMKPTGLGFVFERGRPGGAEIVPGTTLGARRSSNAAGFSIRFGRTNSQALLMSSGPLGGQFFSLVTQGPQAKTPYVMPAAERWAQAGYPNTAKIALATKGFGVKL